MTLSTGGASLPAPLPASSSPDEAAVQQLAAAIHTDIQEALAALLWDDDETALGLLQRAGEHKRALWQQLEPLVTPLARRFGKAGGAGPLLDAGDFTNEAFVKFHKTVGRWQPLRGVPVVAWLRRVLRNHFLDLCRWQRRGRGLVRPDNARAPTATGADGISRIEFDDLLAALLPGDPCREEKLSAFRRHWVEGWTLEELALPFGRSVTTLHHWVHEVRAAFQAAAGR